MAKKTSIDNLSNEIAQALQDYTKEVEEGIDKEADKVANRAVKELRAKSPKKTGKYAKGWTKKKVKNQRIIYNKNKPGLAHLLEFGHAKRGGGRVSGKPHIRPVEDNIIKDFEKVVIEIIRRGGK